MARALEVTGKLLMPKATAVWLIENTALTFKQIANFTELTEIEVEALANEEIGFGLVGRDPIENSEITKEILERCEKDPAENLILAKSDLPAVKSRAKGPRYTPVSKRGDKPDAIAHIIKQNPEISDAQICKLIGTTKPTITAIRERSHPNSTSLRPRHPAELGLCTYQEYEAAIDKGLKAAGKDPDEVRAQREAELEKEREREDGDKSSDDLMAGFDFSNFLSGSQTKKESED